MLSRAGKEALYAPALLQIEIASALVKLAHRLKITTTAISDILTEYEALEVLIDRTPPSARTVVSMCRRYALSAYDATYLELAMRLDLPLAANDGPLLPAARKSGISLA